MFFKNNPMHRMGQRLVKKKYTNFFTYNDASKNDNNLLNDAKNKSKVLVLYGNL